MRNARLGLCLAISLVASGCGPCGPASVVSGSLAKPEAEKLANAYFDHFRAKNYDACLQLYSPDFWKSAPKAQWQKILPNVEAELGPLKTCELTGWRAGEHVGTSGTGTRVDLTYACKHEKYDATVSFRVFTPVGGKPAIVAQNFASIGFLIE